MPSRSQAIIRRDINRLQILIERLHETFKALAAIKSPVDNAAALVNNTWQKFQQAAVAGDKERAERDSAIATLIEWIQNWRPVVLMLVAGASSNIRQLPSSGATPDDVIRVAEDMVKFIDGNQGAEAFREDAKTELADKLESARKETQEASAALPAEAAARQAYSDASIAANNILIPGTEIIRANFGRTSPEYKQFIARSKPDEEEQIDTESETGEQSA